MSWPDHHTVAPPTSRAKAAPISRTTSASRLLQTNTADVVRLDDGLQVAHTSSRLVRFTRSLFVQPTGNRRTVQSSTGSGQHPRK